MAIPIRKQCPERVPFRAQKRHEKRHVFLIFLGGDSSFCCWILGYIFEVQRTEVRKKHIKPKNMSFLENCQKDYENAIFIFENFLPKVNLGVTVNRPDFYLLTHLMKIFFAFRFFYLLIF